LRFWFSKEVKEMRIGVGMDLHSKKSTAHAVYAGAGETPERYQKFIDSFNGEFLSFPSTYEGMKHMVDFLGDNEYEVLIENSSKTHETYWILTNMGCKVTVAFAADLYRITKSVKKTDRNDSIELAGYMRRRMNGEREFSECYIPSPEWMLRREMCRAYLSDGEHLADLKRRIRSHLLVHGLKLDREYSDITSPKARESMRRLNDPCLAVLNSDVKATKERRKLTEKAIADLFKNERNYYLIGTIPGFATVSSAYISSLVIDVSRFRTAGNFTAYFGVVPKMSASADSNPRCSTTHRGDEDLRKMLSMCTLVHIQCVEDSVVTQMYKRLKAAGKPHKEALTAASRKMLVVIYSVLRSGRRYTDDQELLATAREMHPEDPE
jgi:transposase